MKEEKIVELVESLIEENENTPIIVEGKRDEIALRKIGLKGEILRLNLGMTLTSFCEFIINNYSRVILLLDWDRKGNELSILLEKILVSNGIVCEIKHREEIQAIVGNSIRSVEEIYPLYVLSLERLTFKSIKRNSRTVKK